MTNSEQGYALLRKIMHAIAYLKCWPVPLSPRGISDAEIPFVAAAETRTPCPRSDGGNCGHGDCGGDWAAWQGRWGADWSIVSMGTDAMFGLGVGLGLGFRHLEVMKLMPAAWGRGEGRVLLGGGKGEDKREENPKEKEMANLVVQGLEMMLRLKIDEHGRQVVHLWDGPTGRITTLRRCQD